MTENKTNILKVAFPNFIHENFYVECADGWFDLIAEVCQYAESKSKHIHAQQIKEKFGLLRIYFDCDYDENGEPLVSREVMEEIYSFVNNKEHESKRVCEDCGIKLIEENQAKQEDLGYWIRNVCVPCFEEVNKKVTQRLENKIYKTLKEQP
jgi:hypothetical protein